MIVWPSAGGVSGDGAHAAGSIGGVHGWTGLADRLWSRLTILLGGSAVRHTVVVDLSLDVVKLW